MANQSMGLVGRKLGMTQIFDANGNVTPVTVIEVGPNTVLRAKSEGGRDGYNALQLTFGAKKASRHTKADLGQFAKAGIEGGVRVIREIRVGAEQVAAHAVGTQITVGDVFTVGERVDVCGSSKGRGFAGVMKRHNFAGFERSHGVHEYFRHGGSIGTRLTPGMTLKGKKMPGQMGAVKTTVQNLQVARIDVERNLIFVRGGVPGATGAFITVRKAVKG